MRTNRTKRILLIGSLFVLAGQGFPAAAEAKPASLVHHTGREVAFEVTSNGLSRITFKDRALASGEWSVFNAESWFSRGASNGLVRAGQFQERTLDVLSPTHAVVRHRRDDLLCVFDYTFDGEDVMISALVENHHPEAPLDVTGFSVLTFTFDRPPTGQHHAMHPTYSQAHGIRICHPSIQNPLGGRYAADDTVGVGFSPWKTGLERTLILLDYGSWEADKRDNDPVRKLLWRRFDTMIKRGCTLFYLDSFGDSLEDVKLMRWLREKLGPNVRTYCEHQCDAIVPYSGGYSETTLHAEPKDNPPHYRVWSGVDNWEIYRWLCPGTELAARFYQQKGQAPAGFETPDEFYARHQIIPLVPVNDFSRAPAIQVLQAKRTQRDSRR